MGRKGHLAEPKPNIEHTLESFDKPPLLESDTNLSVCDIRPDGNVEDHAGRLKGDGHILS